MIRIKTVIIGISLWFIPFFITAQNWQKLGVGSNHAVRCMFADTTNNKLYIGKDFMGGGFNGLNIWNSSSWDSLAYVQTPVYAINRFQNNIIVSSGYGNQKWDGTNWVPIGSGGVGLYNDNNNYLYSVGWFDSIGMVPASRVAKWNGTSWAAIDTTHWENNIACSIIYKGDLYIGGNFWNADASIDRIARWDGVKWHPVGNGIKGGIAFVTSFEIYKNELYVGGWFNTSNGNPGNAVAKWDGTQWSDVGGGMTGNNASVNDLQVFNGELYAVGGFTKAGGVAINDIAKWDGTDWCGLGYSSTNGNPISSIAVLNNELYIAGGFDIINGDTMNYVSKWIGGNYVSGCGNTTGIIESKINNETLNIYPNPTTNQITIEFNTSQQNALIEVRNVLGEILYSEKLKSNTLSQSINVSEFSNGVYFVTLQNDKQKIVSKFIKN